MLKLVCILYVSFICHFVAAFNSAYQRPSKWTFPFFNLEDSSSESYEYDSEPGVLKYYNINPYKMAYKVPIVQTIPLCEAKESRIDSVIIEKPKDYCKCRHTLGLCKFCRKKMRKHKEANEDGTEFLSKSEENQMENHKNLKMNELSHETEFAMEKSTAASNHKTSSKQKKQHLHKNEKSQKQIKSKANGKKKISINKFESQAVDNSETQKSAAGSTSLKKSIEIAESEINLNENEKSKNSIVKEETSVPAGLEITIGSEASFGQTAATETSSHSTSDSKASIDLVSTLKSNLASGSHMLAEDTESNILGQMGDADINLDRIISPDSILAKQPTKRNAKAITRKYVEPIAAETNFYHNSKQKRHEVHKLIPKQKFYRKSTNLRKPWDIARLYNFNKNRNVRLRPAQDLCSAKPKKYDISYQNEVVDVPRNSDEEISQILHTLHNNYNTDHPINYLHHLKTAQNTINEIRPTKDIIKKKPPVTVYLNKIISKRCDLDDKKFPSYTVNSLPEFTENDEEESYEFYEEPEKLIQNPSSIHVNENMDDIFSRKLKENRIGCKNWWNINSEENKGSSKCPIRPAYPELYGYTILT